MFMKKTLRLNNLKTRTALNAKVTVFVICVEAIKYLLYDFDECSFLKKSVLKIFAKFGFRKKSPRKKSPPRL